MVLIALRGERKNVYLRPLPVKIAKIRDSLNSTIYNVSAQPVAIPNTFMGAFVLS